MANVHLTPAELKGKRPLPSCCIVCGGKGAKLTETAFALQAGHKWSVMTGSVSVMRYLTTSLPLCSTHKTYFTSKQWRVLYIFGAVVAFFILMMGVSLCAILFLRANAVFVIAPVVFLAVLGLFGFIGYMFYLSKSGVYPSAINREGVRLANVADKFVKAMEKLRAEQDEPDESELEEFSEMGSTSRRDDDEDERPRRKRR